MFPYDKFDNDVDETMLRFNINQITCRRRRRARLKRLVVVQVQAKLFLSSTFRSNFYSQHFPYTIFLDSCCLVALFEEALLLFAVDQGQRAVEELSLSAGVDRGGVESVAGDDPLGGEEAVDADGAARVDPPGGDAHLRTQAHPVAVGHPAMGRGLMYTYYVLSLLQGLGYASFIYSFGSN